MQSFRLVFPAVDPEAKTIDFVNGDGRYDIRIFDIELKEKQVEQSEFVAYYSRVKPLIGRYTLPILNAAPAVYSGKIENYDPRYFDTVYLNCRSGLRYRLLSGNIPIPVNPDGTFSIELPVYAPITGLICIHAGVIALSPPFYLEPGRETVQSIDLRNVMNRNLHFWPEECDTIPSAVSNYGELARFNDDFKRIRQVLGRNMRLCPTDRFTKIECPPSPFGRYLNEWEAAIDGMSAAEYKAYVFRLLKEWNDRLNRLGLCERAADWAERAGRDQAVSALFSYSSEMDRLYRKKTAQPRMDIPLKDTVFDDPGPEYYDFVKDFPFNDELTLAGGTSACSSLAWWLLHQQYGKEWKSLGPADFPSKAENLIRSCLSSSRTVEIVGAGHGFFFDLWRLQNAYLLPGLNRSDFDNPVFYDLYRLDSEYLNARMQDGK